jgi:two-component system sensor histidine kinase/response regulator
MRQASAGNDPETMRQLAHGLKGSAANIGADQLYMAVHALEAACDEEASPDAWPADLESLMVSVASALNQVLDSIQSLVASGTGEPSRRASGDTGLSLDALLTRLAAAIERSDPQQVLEIHACGQAAGCRIRAYRSIAPALAGRAGQAIRLRPGAGDDRPDP